MSRRVVITGKGSYVGNELERRLAEFPGEYEVERVSLRDDAWRSGDWSKVDAVVHLAAISRDGKSVGGDSIERVNVDLSIDVARKAKSSGVPQFVFLSSFHVYGRECCRVDAEPVTFETEPAPRSAYGKSKLAAEKALRELECDTFQMAIIRSPLVYGPRCKNGNFPKLVKLSSCIPVFPDVRNWRSMIHSQNLAELIRLLIDDGRGGLYLPQDAEYVETSGLVRGLAEAQGNHVRLSKTLGNLSRLLAPNLATFGKLFGSARYAMHCSDCGVDYRITCMDELVSSL